MSNLIIKTNTAIETPVVYDINHPDTLPDLSKGAAMPVELTSTYWSPDEEGDSIRGFYQGIEISEYEDRKTTEIIELPCVRLLVQDKKGNVSNMRNGSKRLVAAIEDNVRKGIIAEGSPLLITYLGRKKNKKNDHSSDHWSIKPIQV